MTHVLFHHKFPTKDSKSKGEKKIRGGINALWEMQDILLKQPCCQQTTSLGKRLLLMENNIYIVRKYELLGKRLILTGHNICVFASGYECANNSHWLIINAVTHIKSLQV